jgi:hypothetical protein
MAKGGSESAAGELACQEDAGEYRRAVAHGGTGRGAVLGIQTKLHRWATDELLLIISNVGTAVVPYSIHQRVHEAGAVAYVTARLVACSFIAIGIVGMLAISSLRQDAPPGSTPRSGRASSRSMSGPSGWGRGCSPASGTA